MISTTVSLTLPSGMTPERLQTALLRCVEIGSDHVSQSSCDLAIDIRSLAQSLDLDYCREATTFLKASDVKIGGSE